MSQEDTLLKRPLYVYDLPPNLLSTLQPKDDSTHQDEGERTSDSTDKLRKGCEDTLGSHGCQLCDVKFANVQGQRDHARSDLHKYNLKQKIRGSKAVSEVEFEKLLEELNESISGSESSDSDQDEDDKADDSTLSTLLKRQGKIAGTKNQNDITPEDSAPKVRRPPILWLTSSLLPENYSLGVYRALLSKAEQDGSKNAAEILRNQQLSPTPTRSSGKESANGSASTVSTKDPHIFLCMIGGGHFAAMVVSLAPKVGKRATGGEERQASVLAHKTFHRYTTRRKQGGAQSANDASKGAAHSAGSSLRRYNESALTSEVRELLAEWKSLIDSSQLLFIRASGTTNRRVLYGPYENQTLHHNDPRIRGFPFSTRRATQNELMRSFVELTRLKVSQVDEAALAEAAAAVAASKTSDPSPQPKPQPKPRLSKEEEEAIFNTCQLQSLIRRSKAPAVLSFLTNNKVDVNFRFHPTNALENHHAPTPLHFAASINAATVITPLLTKAHADPTILNGEARPPFDLAGDRATRDAFRIARQELGESEWDWFTAHVPPPLTRADADQREEREKEGAKRAETERRQAEMDRLKKEDEERKRRENEQVNKRRGAGKTVGSASREKTGAERREEEARGMTPEMRARLERERRARAAEQRMARLQPGTSGNR